MLKSKLIHPQMLHALAAAGHHSRVLIADSNFPFSSCANPAAARVHLNLSPGHVSATAVLEALVSATPFEEAVVMQPQRSGPYAMKGNPPIWKEFSHALHAGGNDVKLDEVDIPAFYKLAAAADVALAIQTGEERIYANLLLTIGVVMPR